MVSFPCAARSDAQNRLLGVLIGIARATSGSPHLIEALTDLVVVEGLLATLPWSEADPDVLRDLATEEKKRMVPGCFVCAHPCGKTANYQVSRLDSQPEPMRQLRALLLLGLCGVAAWIHDQADKTAVDKSVYRFLYKGLFFLGEESFGEPELRSILRQLPCTV